MLWEQWDNAEDLALHGQQPHFTRLVPQMREIAQQEKFRFED